MHTILIFVDEEFQEIETVRLEGVSLKETIDIINTTTEIKAGNDRFRHEKTGYISIDFEEKSIEVMLKEI